MLTHYPLDKNAFSLDNQYMLSDKLLIRPVMQKGVSKVDVYFPSRNGDKVGDLWYDIDNYRKIDRVGVESVAVDGYKIPVFQRGGTIVSRKMRIRRSAILMNEDPFTLVVALDANKHAKGTLYIDDEKSYGYRQGKYLYLDFEFKDGVLSSK
jgi:alpha 1,3-glucosidase